MQNADDMRQKLINLMKVQNITLEDVVRALKVKYERELEKKVVSFNEAKRPYIHSTPRSPARITGQ